MQDLPDSPFCRIGDGVDWRASRNGCTSGSLVVNNGDMTTVRSKTSNNVLNMSHEPKKSDMALSRDSARPMVGGGVTEDVILCSAGYGTSGIKEQEIDDTGRTAGVCSVVGQERQGGEMQTRRPL